MLTKIEDKGEGTGSLLDPARENAQVLSSWPSKGAIPSKKESWYFYDRKLLHLPPPWKSYCSPSITMGAYDGLPFGPQAS